MDVQLDINKILELYKNRVAELEHERVLLLAKNLELEKMLEENVAKAK